ncbi:hypothetical protein ACKWTF_005830 [Chironomus riparius]
MMQLNQICRLCLEEKTDNETVLVDIFSSLVNEAGKVKLIEKILSTTGVKITRNDGRLPSKICHKCLVSIESFVEFRDKVRRSDEKLRILLNLDRNEEQSSQDVDPEELDEFEEIVKLDPNKVYESSEDETEQESSLESSKPSIAEPPIIQQEKIAPSKVLSNTASTTTSKQRKEIFHCKYCDVVFSDSVSCTNHESFNHDPVNPYECNICSLKFNQHQNLIVHIKTEHNTDKPFFCVQCSKNFIRRSDLKKHTFVHAGIRMFSCNLCSKSFTRSTNLAKHKRTHQEIQKNFKCTLCPKAFVSNAELSSHMEIHMNRNTFNCKYCNQAFTQRDELDVHQKTHITPVKSSQITIQPLQPAPIVFYNQNPIVEQQQFVPQNQAPMNFYTENVESIPLPQPPQQPKIEYPIMNQLLTSLHNSVYKCEKCFEQFPTSQLLLNHQTLYHSKNFTCGICNSSYYKKKELDRHVITAHTDVRYNCSKCSKSFSRKDKLARHEKTHLIPAFYNCALCPAVFIRKHLLDLHSKIHLIPNQNILESSALVNSLNLEQRPQISQDQPMASESFIPSFISPIKQRSPLDLSPMKHIDPPAVLYPLNLSLNQQLNPMNEPMDLSNDKSYDDCVSITKIEPVKIDIESDNDLKIIENNNHEKENDQKKVEITESMPNDFISPKTENLTSDDGNVENIQNFMNATGDQKEDAKMEDLSFHSVTSRLSDLDKLEPSRDLPMEILQSPDI